MAFRYLAADQHPDHDSIAIFRQTHLQALAGWFMQALQLCEKAGLVKLGHVAIDGRKLKANASKHKAMSYERMTEKEKQLREEVKKTPSITRANKRMNCRRSWRGGRAA